MYMYMYMYMYMSHPRQLIFLRKSDCLGCAVLLCLVVCLTLLDSFFLPFHHSLKHVHVYISHTHMHTRIRCTTQPLCFSQRPRAPARGSGGASYYSKAPSAVPKIKEALNFMRNHSFEVPFIANYRKEYVEPELDIHDLWTIWQSNEKVHIYMYIQVYIHVHVHVYTI